MTPAQITKWANEVGMNPVIEWGYTRFASPAQLQRFAQLVRNEALAEPAVEPCGYRYKYLNFMGQEVWSFDMPRGQDAKVLETQAVYASPPPPAKVPAAWLSEDEIGRIFLKFEGSLQSLRDCASEIEKAYRRKVGL